MSAPVIYQLKIERFRGIKGLSWRPNRGVNVILGGGDVGKTTILDAIGLLLSPTTYPTLSDTDYYARDVEAGFVIEAVLSLPANSGISNQAKHTWPWEWNGTEAVPIGPGDEESAAEPVYRFRLYGGADLEPDYQIVQPDESADPLPVSVRRKIGVVRLSGDDRNDRDLRLAQGSALDRLISDKGLRSRLANELAQSDVKDKLADEARTALEKLDETFEANHLPTGLDLAITATQGFSVTASVGLTAKLENVQLPLASWGAGTRRLATLTIAEQNQGESPIALMDEVERGLEPYRQRAMMEKLQAGGSQGFVTTHSPSVISAASGAGLWYVDHKGRIGQLDQAKIRKQAESDPEMFLARLAVVAEGATELGFLTVLLEKAIGSPLKQHGIYVADGGGNDKTLDVLEVLAEGGLLFGAFVDDEGTNPTRWQRVGSTLGSLLFRWKSGCIEENIVGLLPEDKLLPLLTDPEDEKTGTRLRTLADRLGIEDKGFETVKSVASAGLRQLFIDAALGKVPEGTPDKKSFESHSRIWFKSVEGGRELAEKVFALGIWASLEPDLLPFCNAVRAAVGLPTIKGLPDS